MGRRRCRHLLHGVFASVVVSTADQNPDHQIDALLRAGVAQDAIYVDRASGAKASRPQLDELLKLTPDDHGASRMRSC